jgi:predicted nucleic acid-binding protein
MYLLDTNVVSELRKIRAGKADRHVADWADSIDATDLYLSAITIVRFFHSLMDRVDGRRRLR